MGDRINLAVLGTGYWGTKLCKEYSLLEKSGEMDDFGLACVADISESALGSIHSQLARDDVDYAANYGSVLKSDKIDAVHIALPNELHYQVAREALESGKHVLIEKPMATTSRDAYKLARYAEEMGLVLQVGHIFRFNSALRTVRALLDSGQIGKPYYAKLVWTAYMPPPQNRDIVFDLAPHPIDVLNYLSGEWPERIDAIGDSFIRGKESQEEMAFINLTFPDRFLASVEVSWIQHGAKERGVRLVGENGTIECDALNQRILLHRANGADEVPLFPFEATTRNHSQNSKNMREETGPNNTIRAMQLHFLDRIKGRGPQFNSALIGATTVRVLEEIVHAVRMRNGEWDYFPLMRGNLQQRQQILRD